MSKALEGNLKCNMATLLHILPMHLPSFKPNHQINEDQKRKRNATRFCCKVSTVCVDILADIIFLAEVKKLPDLGCSLWTSRPWFFSVSQPRQIMFSLLHYNQVQNRKVKTNNTPTNRFSPAFSIASSISTEAWGACSHKKE